MYYSEINKIIEAGLDKDKEKVSNYARLLAKKLEEDGEIKSSKRVLEILKKKNFGGAVTDALVAPPVDQESRMNIIEIDYHPEAYELVFSRPVQLKLKDFEDTVKNKSQMDELGLEFNLSLLLYGHPGCGKTSAARYIAAQLKLPLVIARLDTLISSLLGNTAKNIHKIFEYAKRQPCVLFLDEFDAIAKARDDQHEMGELKRVVNSLLQNMDEYCRDGILVAATNHHELLDKAIWRRFQTVIELPKPGTVEIQQLFNQLPKMIDYTLIKQKQWQKIESALLGLSYSDIKSILQNMVKKVILNKQKQITFTEVLAEIYLFKNHGDFSMDEFVQYMIDSGVSQKQAANFFQVSTRQIRNSLERMGSL